MSSGASLLTAEKLITSIRAVFEQFPDVRRRGNHQTYTVANAALSAFAVFFTQSPSFLDYQVRMQQERGRNNADSLFGVHQIPSTPQIRTLLDPVSPDHVAPLFMETVGALNESGELEAYRSLGRTLLIPLDGTEYFCSEKVSCPHCSTRTPKNGRTQYYHTVVTPVIVAPGQEAVFPLPPEFVRPQDGHAKQDCELAAAGRWLTRWGDEVARWGATFLGDDLYCHQPFCEQVLARQTHFLFVCRPESHATLYEWVADFERQGQVPTLIQSRWDGKQRLTDTYRYLPHLPLRNSDDALPVNWCELTTTDASGKVLYRNAWATSHAVTAENVAEVARAGRSRWKIENENNNTLKTKGYHFEHNYGHGKQHLSALLATLILLAYLTHTVLDRMKGPYRSVRERLPSRRTFFEHLRALALYLPFASWDHLFAFMLEALQPAQPRPQASAGSG
jgi:hypothetical protein